MTPNRIGYHVLRIGLAILFLWFGFSQLLDSLSWVSWVPDWAVNLLSIPPAMIVMLNGVVEVLGGTILAMGLFVLPVVIILGLHLLVIVVEIGATAIGVRDFGLMMATFALGLLGKGEEK